MYRNYYLKYILTAFLILCAIKINAQSVDFSSTNITCFGAANGTITATISGGSSVYIYYLSKLSPSPPSNSSYGPTIELEHIFSGLVPGTYFISIYDTVAAVDIAFTSIIISQPAQLNATVSSTNIVCFDADNGTITFSSPVGGSGAWEYSIDGGTSWHATSGYTGLEPGNYDCYIRDANATACTRFLSTQTITELPQMSATVASTNITCNALNNGTITINSPTGGSGTYQYQITGYSWQNGPSYTFSGLSNGTYAVSMRDAANTSCVVSLGNVVITRPAQISTTIAIQKGLTCFDGSDGELRAVPSGGTPPYNYLWEKWNGSLIVYESIGQPVQTAVGLDQGRYRVTVGDNNGCPTVNSVIYFTIGFTDSIPPSVPQITNVETVNSCQGQNNGAVTLTGSGGIPAYTFALDGGPYQAGTSFTGLAPSTYTTWIRDSKGCIKQGANAIVGEDPILPISVSITADPSGAVCPGVNVNFEATPAHPGATPVYQWQINGSNVGANADSYSSSTLVNGDQVRVILTSSERCTSGNPATSNVITMALNTIPQVTSQPSNSTICAGDAAQFVITATGTGINYQWQVNTGSGWNNISGAGSNPTYADWNSNQLNISGTIASNNGYQYRCVVSGTCSPDATSDAALLTVNTVPDQPSVITGDNDACQGSTETYSVTNVAGVTYTWAVPGDWTITSGQGTNSITVTVGTTAGNITVTPSNGCGNGASRSLAVVTHTVPAQPSVITGDNDPCQGSTETYSVTNVAGVT
ncbi:MAG: SprB repeat-containing protein, partial [Bacteroidales bacterium]|nr:SprB repeat-containing protein [Bacteroidales bacterium]